MYEPICSAVYLRKPDVGLEIAQDCTKVRYITVAPQSRCVFTVNAAELLKLTCTQADRSSGSGRNAIRDRQMVRVPTKPVSVGVVPLQAGRLGRNRLGYQGLGGETESESKRIKTW